MVYNKATSVVIRTVVAEYASEEEERSGKVQERWRCFHFKFHASSSGIFNAKKRRSTGFSELHATSQQRAKHAKQQGEPWQREETSDEEDAKLEAD